MEVYKAICAIQTELAKTGISKSRSNQQQGFKYRGIDDVYNELSALLAENQLCILPRITNKEVTERVNSKGTALFYSTVTAEFDLVSAKDGSKHTVCSYGEAMDSGDKSIGKAMSYAYKAMAFMLFAIPTEGDNDPDAKTHEVQPKQAVSKTTTPSDGMPKVNQTLHDELAAWCKGDETQMNTLLNRLSHYESDGKEYFFTLDRLPKISEKWVTKVLADLRKMIAADTQALQEQADNIPF